MENQATDLLRFLDESPCNFLAVKNIADALEAAGFRQLDMADSWALQPGDRCYVVKNSSAIFAFVVGSAKPADAGFRIVTAHSDSPGFRIKPNAEIVNEGGVVTLNTEVYGGPILYTWFDRPLSISGRVILRGASPLKPETRLVNFRRPLLTIPHLAIHYNRSVNEGNPLSKQRDMLPVLGRVNSKEEGRGLLTRMVAAELQVAPEDILDFDLTLYDTTPACLFGLNNEFISSGRIDDLEMAHAALAALIAACNEPNGSNGNPAGVSSTTVAEAGAEAAPGVLPQTRVMAIFDNEETGSGTKQGAASPILRSILERIAASRAYAKGGSPACSETGGCQPALSPEDFSRAIANSFMISADNGHALHPNYPSKQDPTNHPIPGEGPVIKINANCKYMTDAHSAAIFRSVCEVAGVRCQTFVNHSDTAGGSTLGNILTGKIEIDGVDMGAPQWAMHSCRETAAIADYFSTLRAFTAFYNL
jgi:aspartyl aminopeptidase